MQSDMAEAEQAAQEEEKEESKESAAQRRDTMTIRSNLPEKQLKQLEILDKRMEEYQEAVKYAMG